MNSTFSTIWVILPLIPAFVSFKRNYIFKPLDKMLYFLAYLLCISKEETCSSLS